MTKYTVVSGRENRRKNDPQKIVWDREQAAGCRIDVLDDRRIDQATRRALANILHSVNIGQGRGLAFAVLNTDGTLDVGLTGAFYDCPVFAEWAAGRVHAIASQLINHPDFED